MTRLPMHVSYCTPRNFIILGFYRIFKVLILLIILGTYLKSIRPCLSTTGS